MRPNQRLVFIATFPVFAGLCVVVALAVDAFAERGAYGRDLMTQGFWAGAASVALLSIVVVGIMALCGFRIERSQGD